MEGGRPAGDSSMEQQASAFSSRTDTAALARMHRRVLQSHPDALLPAFPACGTAAARERYVARMARRPDILWARVHASEYSSRLPRAATALPALGVPPLPVPRYVRLPAGLDVLARLHAEEDLRVRRYAAFLVRLRARLTVLDAAMRRQAHAARLFLQAMRQWDAGRRGTGNGCPDASMPDIPPLETSSPVALYTPLESASMELGAELSAVWSTGGGLAHGTDACCAKCTLDSPSICNDDSIHPETQGTIRHGASESLPNSEAPNPCQCDSNAHERALNELSATRLMQGGCSPHSCYTNNLRFGTADVGRVIEVVQEQLDAQLPALCAYMAQHSAFLRAWDQAAAWRHATSDAALGMSRGESCRGCVVRSADSNGVGGADLQSDDLTTRHTSAPRSSVHSDDLEAARAHVRSEGAQEAEERWRTRFERRSAALRTQLAIFWAHARDELRRAVS